MKKEKFHKRVLINTKSQLDALAKYKSQFPDRNGLYNGKTNRQIYAYPDCIVVVWETKTLFHVDVL